VKAIPCACGFHVAVIKPVLMSLDCIRAGDGFLALLVRAAFRPNAIAEFVGDSGASSQPTGESGARGSCDRLREGGDGDGGTRVRPRRPGCTQGCLRVLKLHAVLVKKAGVSALEMTAREVCRHKPRTKWSVSISRSWRCPHEQEGGGRQVLRGALAVQEFLRINSLLHRGNGWLAFNQSQQNNVREIGWRPKCDLKRETVQLHYLLVEMLPTDSSEGLPRLKYSKS
jgi:hypothetical protein